MMGMLFSMIGLALIGWVIYKVVQSKKGDNS